MPHWLLDPRPYNEEFKCFVCCCAKGNSSFDVEQVYFPIGGRFRKVLLLSVSICFVSLACGVDGGVTLPI